MVGPSVASERVSPRSMRFYSPAAQLIFWILGIVLAWYLIGPGAERLHWWWPFHRTPRVAVVEAPPSASPPPGWTAAAKAALPAVVNVATARTAKLPDDPFSRLFFGNRPPRRERGLGSGVIVTADGFVLTNNHVVEGAQDIRVTLADRREVSARLVGTDPKTDLAVLKLPGAGYPVVALADSSRVEVAEVVLALGNPFGLSQTVTQGIVSAVGRADLGIADYEDFIQTDAPINPGNSGGALVDARGALIGINTAIFSQTGGSQGIGFAVPVNMARQVMDQLVRRGRLTRGYLGVSLQEVTPALARGLGVSAERGVIVGDVAPDSPAARDKPERQQVERDGNAEHGQMQTEGFEPEPRRQGYHQGIHAGRQGSEPREADASGEAPHARSQVKKSRSRDQLPGAVRASQGRRSASKPQTRPAAENAKQNWGRVSSTQIQYHSPGTLKAPSAILTCQRNPPIPASRVRRPSSRPSPSAISTTKVM